MKKLKDQKGASFVFALVALVVATVISVTILSAANTTMKRVSDDVKTQQTRLTLTSAAKLVRDEMKNTTMVETTTKDPADPTKSITTTVYKGDFKDIVESIMGLDDQTSHYDFQIGEKSDAVEVIEESNVVKVIAVKKDNDLIFTFELEDETAFLTMTAQTSTTVSSEKTEKVTSWQTAVITGITQTGG